MPFALRSLRRCGWFLALSALLVVLALSGWSCGGSSGRNDEPTIAAFGPVFPLTAAEVESIVDSASAAVDSASLIVVVVDRLGRPLIVWIRDLSADPTDDEDDVNIALSIARTAAFLSSSQGPISSRTLEYISTFHFPPTFGGFENQEIVDDVPAITSLARRRATIGVSFTPQGPLWQIFSSNRGTPLAGAGLTTVETGEETLFIPGQEIPPPLRLDVAGGASTAPGPGLSYLPGGVPLYKSGRLVGAVACYIEDVDEDPVIAAMEFAAFSGAAGNGFAIGGVPDEGAIFLVGILLPYLENTQRPVGLLAGTASGFPAAPASGDFIDIDPDTVGDQFSRAGLVDPFGYLIGPREDPLLNLTLPEVMQIIDDSVDGANKTRAAIRLPVGTATRMFIAVTNLDGLILALFRMEDAPIFSMDVSVAKARNCVYFSNDAPAPDPLDRIPGVPLGTAITNRTLGFLTQPRYPPGIDNSALAGPLFEDLAVHNQDPAQYDKMAHAPARAGLQNGVIFFPGAAPLYRDDVLVGGIGVSGDGVEEDDRVTSLGVGDFDAPEARKASNYVYEGVRLPYWKFPQNPGGG